MAKRKRAVIWLAVSTEAQAGEEKASLEAQETALTAIAKEHGFMVVDVLRVPGFSRNFHTWEQFTYEADAQGIDAPAKMTAHWQARDFDVLLVYDATRVGRTQTLVSYFVEVTLAAGAIIMTARGETVDKSNAGMFISFQGYASKDEIMKFVARSKAGKRKAAARGLTVKDPDPFTHVIIRDKTGSRQHMVVDESKRRLFTDFLTVLCGDETHPPAPWRLVEQELYDRFGHADDLGRPHYKMRFRSLVNQPIFWGHTMYGGSKLASRPWLWDESIPVPDGVELHRNTTEAVFTGVERDKLVSELKRRSRLKGTARPNSTYAFSRLVVCAECGRRMVVQNRKARGVGYFQCPTNREYGGLGRYGKCTQSRMIRTEEIHDFLNVLLSRLLAGSAPELFKTTTHSATDVKTRIEALGSEIEALEREITGIIVQRATIPEAAALILENLIDNKSAELEAKRKALDETRRAHMQPIRADEQRAGAIAQLRKTTLTKFWALPEVEQNKLLHRLMGTWCIEVLEGEIVGLVDTSNKVR